MIAYTWDVMGTSTPRRLRHLPGRFGRLHAFGDHLRARRNLLGRFALAQPFAETAVAAVAAEGGDDQVAHAAQSEKCVPPRAQRHAEPGHLRQPARAQRRLRVVAESNPVAGAGGDGDDVLERAAQLDANDVVVRVNAEPLVHENFLGGRRQRRIFGGHDHRRGDAAPDFLGVARARERDDRGPSGARPR